MEHNSSVSVDEQFTRSARLKRNLVILMVVGALLFIGGAVFHAYFGGGHGHEEHGNHSKLENRQYLADAGNSDGTEDKHDEDHQRHTDAGHDQKAHQEHEKHNEQHHEEGGHHGAGFDWKNRVYANLWIDNVYFAGIAVIGLFFVLVQYASWAGWSAVIKKIPESFGAFLPVVFVTMAVTFAFGNENIFMWIENPQDELVQQKSGYLNVPFFVIRSLIYFAVWYLVWWYMRKWSAKEDLEGSEKYYHKTGVLAGGFMVIFAITSSSSAWDWVMSIDAHWFSTMFGWYVFASWWVTGIAVITLVTIYLKEAGYLKAVNESHIHNLGLYIFAFSIFWTYTWFEQFLLYFYVNLPEEAIYFIERLHGHDNTYTLYFYALPVLNFVFPFLALMTRDSKRKIQILKIVAFAVLIGHWLDFFVMIMPGTTGAFAGIGILEIGGAMFFAALFIYVITRALEKQKLIPVNHPMLQESVHHEM